MCMIRAMTLPVLADGVVCPAVRGWAVRAVRVHAILMHGARVDISVLKEVLVSKATSFEIPGEKPFIRQMDPLTLSLMGNYESKFRDILEKSINGDGCPQLLYAYENQTTLEEPLWRAALSVAHRCSDGEKAIHMLSKQHPDYSPKQ